MISESVHDFLEFCSFVPDKSTAKPRKRIKSNGTVAKVMIHRCKEKQRQQNTHKKKGKKESTSFI